MDRRFPPAQVKPFWKKLSLGSMLTVAHMLPLTLIRTGVRRSDCAAFIILYVITAHAVSLSLHRYFAHRSFRTSRFFQFCLALLACSIFGDPVWFAGKHRLHHKLSDTSADVHSPLQGLWHCWIGSILDNGHTKEEVWSCARDWSRFPELRLLSRFFYLPGIFVAGTIYVIGGYRMFVTGYCLAFLVALHGSSAVNYLCHRIGYRRFATHDLSTNNLLLGYLFFGEGWHNNHHSYPSSARFSCAWYEIDLVYVSIRLLAGAGLIWHVNKTSGTNVHRVRERSLASSTQVLERIG